ncbi:MAG: aminodeoxychorismate lyase [Arenimonas sp.]
MTARVVNLAGDEADFGLNDRGLAYGDGVFETVLVHAGKPVWWEEHWQRLLRGAGVLKIPAPDENPLRKVCNELITDAERCVLKIILTRGSGGRGYAIPDEHDPRIIISVHPAPANARQAVNLRWCETRLARQPLLAGIKHLNRLEQVLARNEWQGSDIFDGLMCDMDNHVVCATSANVFARVQGQWLTPIIDQAGIAGIARSWVLKNLPQVREAHLSRVQIEQAEAIFICNAVRGILAVNRLGEHEIPGHPEVRDLQNLLAQEQAAFAIGEHSGS